MRNGRDHKHEQKHGDGSELILEVRGVETGENDDDDDERRHELRHIGEEVCQPVHALVDAAHELKMLGIVASLVHRENGNASAQHGETHDCKHGDDERRVRVFSLRDVALLQFEHVARVKMYPRLERHVARAST